jgi:hypothetical protein
MAHSYIPFGKYEIEVKIANGTDTKTTVLALNEPLRSLPNGVKDKAYIKNNKLYVDRYVGSVVLNGSESWAKSSRTDVNRYFLYKAINTTSDQYVIKNLSSHFKSISQVQSDVPTLGMSTLNADGLMVNIDKTDTNLDTLDKFKTWLSNNNVQVDYELATPVTEEVGECVIYTYEGVNNINLKSNLETEFSVTYAQDMKSILKDYPSMEEIQAYVDSQLGTINEQLASLTEVE